MKMPDRCPAGDITFLRAVTLQHMFSAVATATARELNRSQQITSRVLYALSCIVPQNIPAAVTGPRGYVPAVTLVLPRGRLRRPSDGDAREVVGATLYCRR